MEEPIDKIEKAIAQTIKLVYCPKCDQEHDLEINKNYHRHIMICDNEDCLEQFQILD